MKSICFLSLFLVASLNATVSLADIAICTAQCDTSITYNQSDLGGKTSGTKTVKELRTSVVQGIGKSTQQAFDKLSTKCSGQLYASKTELHESDYTPASIENSCDQG